MYGDECGQWKTCKTVLNDLSCIEDDIYSYAQNRIHPWIDTIEECPKARSEALGTVTHWEVGTDSISLFYLDQSKN